MSKRKNEIPDLNGLKRLKVPELKQLCDNCGLVKQGLKNDLINRLDQARTSVSPDSSNGVGGSDWTQKSIKPKNLSSAGVGKAGQTSDSRHSTVLKNSGAELGKELFAKYAGEEDPSKITMEGFVRFGQDLARGNAEEAISPRHSFFMFFLSWKMKSSSFAELSKEGFLSGLEAIQCFSIEDLIRKRDVLLSEVENQHYDSAKSTFDPNDRFVAMYMAIFDMLKPEGKKYVEKDMAIEAFQALFYGALGNACVHTDFFLRFLKEKEALGSLNADQWRGFLGFCREVRLDFTGYSDVDPWPSLLDEFVSWCKEQSDWKARNNLAGISS